MIDFWLGHFVWALRLLSQEIGKAFDRAAATPETPVDKQGEDRQRFDSNFAYVTRQCEALVLSGACDRIARIGQALTLDPTYTYFHLGADLRVLMENIYDDIRNEEFYHYPRHKGLPLKTLSADWAATIASFPSAEEEIKAGVDCYALGHNTAGVFHMMRTAEHGLRSLARSLRVAFPKSGTPIEWAQWQDLIDQIRANGKTQADALPKGERRDAARDFYSGAVHHFEGFKDKYRNAVMHVRKTYDELDALRAINQVRDFMNGLSAKIGEKTRSPIRRWP